MKEKQSLITLFLMVVVIGVGLHAIIKTFIPNPDAVPEMIRLLIALSGTAAASLYLKSKI